MKGWLRANEGRRPEASNPPGRGEHTQSRRLRCEKVCDRGFLKLFNSGTGEEAFSGSRSSGEGELSIEDFSVPVSPFTAVLQASFGDNQF